MRGAAWAVGLGLATAAMLLAGACSDEAESADVGHVVPVSLGGDGVFYRAAR
jgi:hypothetical protein